jgi:hypothetical protein
MYWITKVITVVRAAPWVAEAACQNDKIKVVTAAARTPTLTLAVGVQLAVGEEVRLAGSDIVLVDISLFLLSRY